MFLFLRALLVYALRRMLRDAFGHLRPVRWGMINLGGYLTALQLRVLNRLRIHGVENLKSLPSRGVLLVSNHLTHYMDAIVVFHSVSYLRRPYLIWPRTDLYIVAALETMKNSGWLPRLMAYNGTICVKRTWKESGKLIERPVDPEDIQKVKTGIEGGWVLTFPQGTTTPGAPGRIGCAQIIKQLRPVVLPVRLEGLREAFDKTGLKLRKIGVELSVRYGRPLEIDYDLPASSILGEVMAAIGEA
jgi:1-acyl-sn-glycerol-3-phosphate acyltransferase